MPDLQFKGERKSGRPESRDSRETSGAPAPRSAGLPVATMAVGQRLRRRAAAGTGVAAAGTGVSTAGLVVDGARKAGPDRVLASVLRALTVSKASDIAQGVRRASADHSRVLDGRDDPLGGRTADDGVTNYLRRTRGRGVALPTAIADSYGERLGTNLGGVRVHTDGDAHAMARSVQSTAFTYGNDIYFTRGAYAPTTQTGQHLLAHELTHVTQQQGALPTVSGATPMIGRADDPAEHEAERVARMVVPALRRSPDVDRPAIRRAIGAARAVVPALRRWPPKLKKVAEKAEKIDEFQEQHVSPPVEALATLGEFGELVAAIHRGKSPSTSPKPRSSGEVEKQDQSR